MTEDGMTGGEASGNARDLVDELRARIRRLEVGALALAVALVASLGWNLLSSTDRHQVLTAERLEIVEPDGQLAFVLANSERPGRGTFGGEVLMEGRQGERAMPNFIFYDGHGDEVGGMLFGNRETGDEFHASRHFSLDGYGQDQTVQLFHQQTPDGANSGLVVNDRPGDRTLPETFRGLGLDPPFTQAMLDSVIETTIPEDVRPDSLRELFGVSRVFLGSSGTNEALLALRDGEGRTRLLAGVPEDGDPYLRFLDEEGDPVTELP